ncbi:MAG: transposase [Chloroflexi bacterium]|nr:transposase [Chloroflexota bacterium]
MVSTSNDKDLSPYWNAQCAVVSSQLLSPAEIDSLVSGSSLSNSSLDLPVEQSWFSTRIIHHPAKHSSKISLPSSLASLQEGTDAEATFIKAKKIRIYPTSEQAQLFKFWLDTSRYIYNLTVENLRKHDGPTPDWKEYKKYINSITPEWALECPRAIRDIAVREACFALRDNKKKVKQGLIDGFELHFRSRKNPMQSCFIRNDAIQPHGIYIRYSGSLKFSEPLPDKPKDSKLIYHRGRWYLSVPYETTTQRHVAENQGRVVALDTGIRTFMTFFSDDSFGWLGDGDYQRIMKLLLAMDNLKSQMAKSTARHRQRLKKAFNKLAHKRDDLIADMHHKVALFLVQNYDIILLPDFEVSNMVKRQKRKINSKTVRAMLGLKFYQFEEHLERKAFEYGKTVVGVNEAYTSKTNSWTGEVNVKLGGRKTIYVDGVPVDRDLNGARGIYLRVMAATPSTIL